MSMPRLTPTLVPESNRFKRPWSDSSRTPRVPLWTPSPEGQWIDGKIDVPVRLCNTPQHSNERLEFERLIRENVERWTEWRRQKGWEIASKPKVMGPFTPPTNSNLSQQRNATFWQQARAVIGAAREVSVKQLEPQDEMRWYMVRARFKRTAPMFLRLDDVLELRDMSKRYGIGEGEDFSPQSLERGGDSGWVDPMQYAEARRQRLGLKREDFLMGPLSEPL